MRIAIGSRREPKLAGVTIALERLADLHWPGDEAAVLAGEDLAAVIDRHANERDVRSRRGAFGVLTAGILVRAEAYAQAVLTALAPWYAPGFSRG